MTSCFHVVRCATAWLRLYSISAENRFPSCSSAWSSFCNGRNRLRLSNQLRSDMMRRKVVTAVAAFLLCTGIALSVETPPEGEAATVGDYLSYFNIPTPDASGSPHPGLDDSEQAPGLHQWRGARIRDLRSYQLDRPRGIHGGAESGESPRGGCLYGARWGWNEGTRR